METFVLTGKSEDCELHVFPHDREQSLIAEWTRLGYTVRHQRQQIDYMGKLVTIKYLTIRNPVTGISMSLIPWFMLPGRRYLIFIYVYAVWHYHITCQKSLEESAKATGKMFKIEKFNKSTVCRSIKAMENIIDISLIEKPLAASMQDMPCGHAALLPEEAAIGLGREILMNCPSAESMKESHGGTVKELPDPVNRKATISFVLSGIPADHSRMIIHSEPGKRKGQDFRKRLPRARKKKEYPVQRNIRFLEHSEREAKRKAFIENCRYLVLDAAVTHHRFLV